MFPSQESLNVPQTQHNSYISTQSRTTSVEVSRTPVELMNRTQSDGFWSDCFCFISFFSLLFGARAGRLGRSAADWVTALKPNRCCLIWQPLSLCVHEGARQIQLHSHKNTLHVSVCLSQSLRYFGFTPSACICFYPRPRYIKPFLCFSSGIYPPRSFLSFHLQI